MLNTVKQLRYASSSLDKINILHLAPYQFKDLLHYAYNPFLKYHINKLPWTGKGEATVAGSWRALTAVLLDLSEGTNSKNQQAKAKVAIESLRPEEAELFKCILTKDLKAGISAVTINKVFPGLIPVSDAMKAKLFEVKRFQPGMLGSVKLDGLRCLYVDEQLYTRNGKKILGVEHIIKELLAKGIHSDLDGEILIPETRFDKTSGSLRSFDNSPDAKFFVFGALDVERPFTEVYRELEEQAKANYWSMSVSKPTTITLVKHVPFYTLDKVKKQYATALNAGFEGLVLKTPDHFYQPGKRSSDWLKLKPTLSKDLRIVGFFQGEGRLKGTLGGVIIWHNSKECGCVDVRVGSGFTDALRDEIWNNQSEFLGKTIEVKYQEETEDGSLRHPRFKSFRPDKD